MGLETLLEEALKNRARIDLAYNLSDILDEFRGKHGIISFKLGDLSYYLSDIIPYTVDDEQKQIIFIPQGELNFVQAWDFYKYYTAFMSDYLDYTIVINIKDTYFCGLYQIEGIQVNDCRDGFYFYHEWTFILSPISK